MVTTSNTISQGNLRMDLADLLNNNNDDEQRILNLVGRLDQTSLSVGDSVYAAAKYALARWVRRHSASYAANGVRINAVAPGNVNTAMTATMSTNAKMALKRPSNSHEIRQRNTDGPGGSGSGHRISVFAGGKGYQRCNPLCRRRYGCLAEYGKSLLDFGREVYQMKTIEKYIEALENKDFEGLGTFLPEMDTTATTAPTERPSMNIIFMARRPSPCSFGTSFSSASIPFWNR